MKFKKFLQLYFKKTFQFLFKLIYGKIKLNVDLNKIKIIPGTYNINTSNIIEIKLDKPIDNFDWLMWDNKKDETSLEFKILLYRNKYKRICPIIKYGKSRRT